MRSVNCLFCNALFVPDKYNVKMGYGKFCSRRCSWSYHSGKNHSRYWLGKNRPEAIKKMNLARMEKGFDESGVKNPNWKGDKVKYHGLHTWINNNFIRPAHCEICKKPDTGKRRFEWASKTHNYTRDIKDWIYLCTSCHIKYDLEHNNKTDNYHARYC